MPFADDIHIEVEYQIALGLNDVLVVNEQEKKRNNHRKYMSINIEQDNQRIEKPHYLEYLPTAKQILLYCLHVGIWVEANDAYC